VSPRARGDSVRPRLPSGVVARPLNFTVRRYMRPLVIAAALGIASCSDPCPHMHFERLREADRAVITVGTGRTYAEIRSPDTLRALATFAQEHSSGWGEPWYGAPVARVYVNFYAGTRFLGDLGVGDFGADTYFLSAQGCEYFQSRKVSSDDRRKLVALIGADAFAAGNK
jgi:hypothetical protein